MRTQVDYQFYEGHMWRWSQMGVFKVRFEPIHMDRLLAGKLLAQHTESAAAGGWFAKYAAELRDELADVIRQYDEYHQPSMSPGSYGMGKEINNGCHV